MFNFLDSKFAPKVTCKTPCTDNYEVDNLISNKYNDKVRGFICYPSIKPPVEIEFEFICPVNIHYIILNTTVGTQRCTGIELFAKTEELTYSSIAKCFYDEPGVLFCNSRKYSKSNLPENYCGNFHQSFFRSNSFKHFLNATGIKIVIFRTERSVPCIGSVEIWGIPSRNCSKVTIDTINHIATKNNEACISASTKSEEFKIPEDFKDDLTCEIMTLPMTLPCGKTVDQSTLEKHIQIEKSFGRKPCDPFTGIKFTGTLKPVLNVGLKSRIDVFVLQHSHREEFYNRKRTLGGRNNNFTGNNSHKRTFESTNDLDEAICRAKMCNNFINFTSNERDKPICLKCKIELNSLYKLPCEHLFCRSCLLEVCTNLKCSICDTIFLKDVVIKCNF